MRRLLPLLFALLITSCLPPPQVHYPSGVTGMVCSSCLTGSRCDPSLLPAQQVDVAAVLVAREMVVSGRMSDKTAGNVLESSWVCLVDTAGMQRGYGSSWPHGDCVSLDVPGSCLAGATHIDVAKVTVREPGGKRLAVWETALAHEAFHLFGVQDGDEALQELTKKVNVELQRLFP